MDDSDSLAGASLSGISFTLPDQHRGERQSRLDRLQSMFELYMAPRLKDQPGPPVIAVVGPTGSGKSTLINSLAGRTVSPAGVIRPTTQRPVVVSADPQATWPAGWMVRQAPELAFSLIDSPDLVTARSLGYDPLILADAALFVITPARYGDREIEEAATELSRWGRPVAIVVNRVTDQQIRELVQQRMAEVGLADRVLIVTEAVVQEAKLTESTIGDVRDATTQWAEDAHHLRATSVQAAQRQAESLTIELAADFATERVAAFTALEAARREFEEVAEAVTVADPSRLALWSEVAASRARSAWADIGIDAELTPAEVPTPSDTSVEAFRAAIVATAEPFVQAALSWAQPAGAAEKVLDRAGRATS